MSKNLKKTLNNKEKYKDVMRIQATISPKFIERIRILFGGKIFYNAEIKTQFYYGKMKLKDECKIQKIFK
jgi:hypothetical protein